MLTFAITTEERRRAQDRAAELDIGRTDPPGRFPNVWDVRLNCVKRWYDYGSSEEKIGTIYFLLAVGDEGTPSGEVPCLSEITHHPLVPERSILPVPVTDPAEHRRLVELFLRELLGRQPREEKSTAGWGCRAD